MFPQVIFSAILIATSYGSPIDSHANSYVSTNSGLGAYRNTGLQQFHGIKYAEPVQPIIKQIPIIITSHRQEEELEEHGPAEYSYSYGVEDQHTGDMKSHKETRTGDVVKGEYSFKEADGTIRTVNYTVDKKSGFNAVVTRSGHANHPLIQQKKIVLKPIYVSNSHEDQHY
ncbi:structural contituent of cuticle [Holotrichia oblita]|uniref:Structural contituent of cuticle n=1 Tax=Holotrichia oblita TaxID=644536 RepID=A0ACB9TC29_HOLOL|nr:structural contituent of cuticle [Holotrichia oblita]